jgi:hypothetical protein
MVVFIRYPKEATTCLSRSLRSLACTGSCAFGIAAFCRLWVKIAVDSTGKIFSNDKVEEARFKCQKQKSHYQKKNMKSTKRKLKKIIGKERRFRTDTNHCVSKHFVKKTKNINVGISLEDLSGITKRTTVKKNSTSKET